MHLMDPISFTVNPLVLEESYEKLQENLIWTLEKGHMLQTSISKLCKTDKKPINKRG